MTENLPTTIEITLLAIWEDFSYYELGFGFGFFFPLCFLVLTFYGMALAEEIFYIFLMLGK